LYMLIMSGDDHDVKMGCTDLFLHKNGI